MPAEQLQELMIWAKSRVLIPEWGLLGKVATSVLMIEDVVAVTKTGMYDIYVCVYVLFYKCTSLFLPGAVQESLLM